MNILSAIPEPQRETARTALAVAFGSTPVTAIGRITGGASGASTWRVEAGGRPSLLRMEGVPSPLRNPHQYQSMRIATEAGIAPPIRYVDETARVAVIDFIDERPLHTYPGGPIELARAVGDMLRRIQGTSPFPRFVEYPDIVARLWTYVCGTGLFAPGVLESRTAHLERIRAAYAWDPANAVSSHNDPVPRNILFDGTRLWMIDWESAYRNDPLVDVAIVLDNLAPSPELEAALLQASLGGPPDHDTAERLALVRALTRLYYAGVLFSASVAAGWTSAETDLSAPGLARFRQSLREGRLHRDAPETRHVLGKMYLDAFFTGVRPPGFGDL